MSEKVRQMFSEISSKYDLMNDILSFGIHHIWRKKAVKLSGIKSGDKVLDLACGTGDLSFEFKRQVFDGDVTGVDFCEDMVILAREKSNKNNLKVNFEVGDALNIQFGNNVFDASSISFGIRNVDDPILCLKEMARVVKPNGKVVVIEFGQPKGLFSLFYKFYSKFIIPVIGKIFASHQSAYQYLPETAEKFPAGNSFLKLMDEANCFSDHKAYSLNFSIAYIYIGVVK